MKSISHDEQKDRWNKEHENPFALKQMDAPKGSSALKPFVEILENSGKKNLVGVEMGCGKGRNVIWLAQQSIFSKVYGFDFSEAGIREAKNRANTENLFDRVQFEIMDATETWRYESDFFDFGIDCTASTDIETPEGRRTAIKEMYRVLKPDGLLLVYAMSTEDEYHKMIIGQSPASEKHAFIHPETGKFEKVFSEEELDEMYKNFELIESRRVNKEATFFGKNYKSFMHWRVYRK